MTLWWYDIIGPSGSSLTRLEREKRVHHTQEGDYTTAATRERKILSLEMVPCFWLPTPWKPCPSLAWWNSAPLSQMLKSSSLAPAQRPGTTSLYNQPSCKLGLSKTATWQSFSSGQLNESETSHYKTGIYLTYIFLVCMYLQSSHPDIADQLCPASHWKPSRQGERHGMKARDYWRHTVIESNVGAPVWLVESLEIALYGVIDWPVSKLGAIIEDNHPPRSDSSGHLRNCLLPGVIWQLVEKICGRHLYPHTFNPFFKQLETISANLPLTRWIE